MFFKLVFIYQLLQKIKNCEIDSLEKLGFQIIYEDPKIIPNHEYCEQIFNHQNTGICIDPDELSQKIKIKLQNFENSIKTINYILNSVNEIITAQNNSSKYYENHKESLNEEYTKQTVYKTQNRRQYQQCLNYISLIIRGQYCLVASELSWKYMQVEDNGAKIFTNQSIAGGFVGECMELLTDLCLIFYEDKDFQEKCKLIHDLKEDCIIKETNCLEVQINTVLLNFNPSTLFEGLPDFQNYYLIQQNLLQIEIHKYQNDLLQRYDLIKSNEKFNITSKVEDIIFNQNITEAVKNYYKNQNIKNFLKSFLSIEYNRKKNQIYTHDNREKQLDAIKSLITKRKQLIEDDVEIFPRYKNDIIEEMINFEIDILLEGNYYQEFQYQKNLFKKIKLQQYNRSCLNSYNYNILDEEAKSEMKKNFDTCQIFVLYKSSQHYVNYITQFIQDFEKLQIFTDFLMEQPRERQNMRQGFITKAYETLKTENIIIESFENKITTETVKDLRKFTVQLMV